MWIARSVAAAVAAVAVAELPYSLLRFYNDGCDGPLLFLDGANNGNGYYRISSVGGRMAI
jgi:hypothetical protein